MMSFSIPTNIRRQIVGARCTALQTAQVLRQVMSASEFSSVEEALEILKKVGQQLQKAQPKGTFNAISFSFTYIGSEYAVGNVVMKIIHIIREEHDTLSGSKGQPVGESSIAKFVLLGQPRRQQRGAMKMQPSKSKNDEDGIERDDLSGPSKPVVINAIQDVQYELESSYENVTKNAKDHIHSE